MPSFAAWYWQQLKAILPKLHCSLKYSFFFFPQDFFKVTDFVHVNLRLCSKVSRLLGMNERSRVP